MGAAIWWWLRSPLVDWWNLVGTVTYDGDLMYGEIPYDEYGARPAFNLNPASVLFSSLVSGTAGEAGAEFKLTLKDKDSGLTITPSDVTRSGDVITVSYSISGTNAGADTQAYVLVTDIAYTDSGAAVLEYTKLTADRTFTLDSNWGTDYKIYLLAVNEGGEKKTDTASTPVNITIPAADYTLEVTAPTFDAVEYGYTQPAAKAITITSTGNCDAAVTGVSLSGDGASAFTLNDTEGTIIAAGATDSSTYTVQPKSGLAVGTYTAVITVETNDGQKTADVSFTVRQNTVPAHTLTINYVYADNTAAADPVAQDYQEGAAYSVKSPDIEGFSPDQDTVSGTMGDADVNVTVTYTENTMKIQVEFVFLKYDGSRGVPFDVKAETLKPVITIKDGEKTVSKSGTVELEITPKAQGKEQTVSFSKKLEDLAPGKYAVSVSGLPKEMAREIPEGDAEDKPKIKLTAKAEVNKKGKEIVITVYLIFDGRIQPKYEEPVVYALPEDEFGAYAIRKDGTKEYLLFQTYDICMSYLGSAELCEGSERCFHKDGK